MKQQELFITKENYLGYTELYKAKNCLSEKEKDQIIKEYMICAGLSFVSSFPIIITTGLFYSIFFCSISSVLSIIPIQHKIVKNKVKKVTLEYPYVNSKVSNIGLCNAFDKVGIKVEEEQVDVREFERKIRLDELCGRSIKNNSVAYPVFSNFQDSSKVKQLVKKG